MYNNSIFLTNSAAHFLDYTFFDHITHFGGQVERKAETYLDAKSFTIMKKNRVIKQYYFHARNSTELEQVSIKQEFTLK